MLILDPNGAGFVATTRPGQVMNLHIWYGPRFEKVPDQEMKLCRPDATETCELQTGPLHYSPIPPYL